ncbi:MAG TPA: lytic transglycosylase domain-containing protein [Draconibacterium sp.]|nr:lytic transglycosylase domain-containing protein [Draconibacterium sp.]
MIKEKKWWKVVLPFIIGIKVAVIILILGSARSDDAKVTVDSEMKFASVKIPEKLTFAGEEMPLYRFDVKEALDRELLSNAYFHSQTIRYIKLAPRFFPVIERILKEKGVPDDFKYLALAESGLNPRAVSPAGAVGFWQFLDGTAKDFGLEVSKEVDERYHVEKSTYAFCNYIRQSYNKFGNWTIAAASYNGGIARMQRQMERQKMEDYYNLLFVDETQRYVFRIAALKLILENPKQYNFVVGESEKYPVIKTRDIEINGPVNNFADFAIENGINYKMLKDFNPWLRDDKLTNAARKKYTVKIPVLN